MLDAMYTAGVDTLKAVKALKAAGFEKEQAEALVTTLGGPVAGNAATKGDVRESRNETKGLRTELKTEIDDLRTEFKTGFAELRAEISSVRGEVTLLKEDVSQLKLDIAEVRTEIVESRGAAREDMKSLKAQMYRLLLVQATVIVGLILGLQRLI